MRLDQRETTAATARQAEGAVNIENNRRRYDIASELKCQRSAETDAIINERNLPDAHADSIPRHRDGRNVPASPAINQRGDSRLTPGKGYKRDSR